MADIEQIFCIEESNTINFIPRILFPNFTSCCLEKFCELKDEDPILACYFSKNSFEKWLKVCKFRITGSRLYSIYTYCFNKNPNWENKTISYFYLEKFNSEKTAHGKNNEDLAIKAYKKHNGLKVATFGCIISKLNPWLFYSPYGVLIENSKPCKLIEVKFPFVFLMEEKKLSKK